jgi:hypothetical protein
MNRDERNQHPHAEARIAMIVWGDEYSKQNGGCMDFWDGLNTGRKEQCVDILERILADMFEVGRWDGKP